LEFLGFLGLGFGIAASIFAAVESLMHQIYLPAYYRGINTDNNADRAEAWNRMAYLFFPLLLSAALLVSALAPFLITVFASSKYADAWPYVLFGVWIETFRSMTNTLSSVAHSEMKTRNLVKSYSCGGLLAALSTYYLSVTGYHYFIPFALTLSGLITLVVMFLEMRKMMEIDVGIRRLLKTVFLALPLVVSIFLFDLRHSILYSFAVCLTFSLYVLFTQYKTAKALILEV
jgi:O-antigen/teichoic acid export membrane protein